jgi:hypothetical protein
VSSNFTWFPRRFYDTRDWPARLLTDAASWEEVHGNTPLCNIPGFSPWRFQTGNSNSLFPMFYPPTNWPVRGAVNKPQLYIPISLCCWLRNLSWPLAHRWPANPSRCDSFNPPRHHGCRRPCPSSWGAAEGALPMVSAVVQGNELHGVKGRNSVSI